MSIEYRRKYDPDFKKQAVQLTNEPGRSVKEVADHLGINKDILYRWRREHIARKGLAFPGNGKERLTPRENEIRELKKKLKDAEMERDILKKAMAIFAKAPK